MDRYYDSHRLAHEGSWADMSLKLLGEDIAVIPLEDPSLRPSGLYIPDEAKQRIDQGIVKYRGPASIELRVGDHVFFSGYTGTKITVEGEGVLIVVPETHVLAIYVDDEAETLFPISVVKELLSQAKGEWLSRSTTGKDNTIENMVRGNVDHLFELLESKFADYVFDKGFEF